MSNHFRSNFEISTPGSTCTYLLTYTHRFKNHHHTNSTIRIKNRISTQHTAQHHTHCILIPRKPLLPSYRIHLCNSSRTPNHTCRSHRIAALVHHRPQGMAPIQSHLYGKHNPQTLPQRLSSLPNTTRIRKGTACTTRQKPHPSAETKA